jgi:ubiquinone/menaquinone biosynthesis C-methylase UbiE
MLTIDFLYLPLKSGDCVLDLGCGEGRHAINIYLQEAVTVVGIDLSYKDLSTAREKFRPFENKDDAQRQLFFQVANGMQLPFADNTFDAIVCSEVLEHVENYLAILQEIRRILKPGGQLSVSVPRYWPEKICWWLSDAYHQVEGGHIRIFKAKQLRQQIENCGFEFSKKHWAHALHTPYWWLRCLFWKSQDSNSLIKIWHRLLVWDLMEKPWLTRWLERGLNPLIGKSVAMYFRADAKGVNQ